MTVDEYSTETLLVASGEVLSDQRSVRGFVIDDRRRPPTRRIVRLAGTACALSALYALGALLPFWYLDTPETGSAFFPPAAGLTLAVLLLSPRRTWPLWLATVAVTETAVDISNGLPFAMSIGFAMANTVEPLVGALAIRQVAADRVLVTRRHLAAFVVLGVAVAPLVGAFIGASSAVLLGGAGDWFTILGNWWLGDALGVLVVATPLLAWARPSVFEPVASRLENLAIVVAAVGVAIVPGLVWHHPVVYAVMPILTWAAIRGGCRSVALAGVGVAFAANWGVLSGRAVDLFPQAGTSRQLVYVQLFLAVTLLSALVLAVEIAERRRAEFAMREAQVDQAVAERRAIESADMVRRQIARDAHDILGHALNVVLLNAGAGRRVIATDQAAAIDFFESIESVARVAFTDLDVALSLIESKDLPETGIVRVGSLVSLVRDTGLEITLDVAAPSVAIPEVVDETVYRIIQEALTNVVKHAPRSKVAVTIRQDPGSVVVSVVNDTSGPFGAPYDSHPGRGLMGMRERVAALDGEFHAGQRDEGFVVWVKLPIGSPT